MNLSRKFSGIFLTKSPTVGREVLAVTDIPTTAEALAGIKALQEEDALLE